MIKSLAGQINRLGTTDQFDDLVQMVQSNGQSLQNMGPCLRFFELETRPAANHILAVGNKIAHHVHQAQIFGLFVHDRQKNDAEGSLQLGVFV